MADYLSELTPAVVAGWYKRLADSIAARQVSGGEPLASQLLRHWLENRDSKSTYSIQAPQHLRESRYVLEVEKFHRQVFLTERRGRFDGGSERWVGVLPRLQGLPGFQIWDLAQPLLMKYESLVEISLVEQVRGTAESRDLLTSLRGFQLSSEVTVTGAPVAKTNQVAIEFKLWTCLAKDRYDWDYTEHFTVPNPDFGSASKEAVRPQDKSLTVYHSNAQRVERAGLAAPYDVRIGPWAASTSELLASAMVDRKRRL